MTNADEILLSKQLARMLDDLFKTSITNRSIRWRNTDGSSESVSGENIRVAAADAYIHIRQGEKMWLVRATLIDCISTEALKGKA